jgi:hypothetical protein
MLDQLTSYLFTARVPRPPVADPDLRAQALELLESPDRLREMWAGVMPQDLAAVRRALGAPDRLREMWAGVMQHLEDDGYEAGEFALLCRLHLNLLDGSAILLEVLERLSDRLQLPPEKLRSAAAEVKAQQEAIRPLLELATGKPPPLDPAKLAEAERKFAGQPAVEVSELIRQVQASEVEL